MGAVSPTPSDEPAKRRRTTQGRARRAGHVAGPRAGDEDPGDHIASATPPATAAPAALPDEPEWLRDAPVEPADRDAGPAISPEEAAKRARGAPPGARRGDRRRLNPEQAPGRHHDRRPAADPRRRRIGQDPRHRPPDRVPHRRHRRPAAPDPRGHVHQPRRRRAPGADRGASSATYGKEVDAGTFHALCARVLRRDGEAIGIDRRFVIYDTDDQQQLMKRILAEQDLPATGEFRPAAILGAISRAKNEMLDADVPRPERRQPPRAGRSPSSRSATRSGSRPAGALDFDDLLLKAVELFERGARGAATLPGALAATSTSTNTRTRTGRSTCGSRPSPPRTATSRVVGDDDQSIYGWRGANVQNILDFERDYPDATVVKLEQNYRSTQLILDAAHAVVSRNERRTDKKLWTENQGGVPIQRFEAFNEEEEAEWIARQVEGLIGQTGRGSWLTRRADDDESTRFRPKDVAVMYRMNSQSRAIEESFLRYGIRYQLVGGTRFYQRREVKDALAYLRVLRSDTDGVSFERVINVPARGIGDKSVEALRRWAVQHDDYVFLAVEAAGEGEVEGLGPRIRTSIGRVRACWSRGCGRGSACCRCPSCWTRSSSSRATGRCSPTAPRRARTAGRTCSSCGRSRPATTTCRRTTRSTGCSRRPRSSPTRTATRARRTRSR